MTMKYAEIRNGVVVNVIVADADIASERGLVAAPANVGPGWRHDGQAFVAPPAPPAEPRRPELAERVLDKLVSKGLLTTDEAEALRQST